MSNRLLDIQRFLNALTIKYLVYDLCGQGDTLWCGITRSRRWLCLYSGAVWALHSVHSTARTIAASRLRQTARHALLVSHWTRVRRRGAVLCIMTHNTEKKWVTFPVYIYCLLSTGLRLLLVMISRDRPESREHGGCSQQ